MKSKHDEPQQADAPAAAPAPGDRRIRQGQISSLRPDNENANHHTPEGMELLEGQIRRNGLARGIVVDKNLRVIGGNGVVEAAVSAGLQQAIFVPVTGNELVVTVRTDVDLDTQRGRELAIGDNTIARKNLDLDADVIRRQAEAHDIDLLSVGVSDQDLAQFRHAAEAAGTAEADDAAQLKELDVKAPPVMTWVLVGVPTVAFGKIAQHVEAIAAVEGTVVETTSNSDASSTGDTPVSPSAGKAEAMSGDDDAKPKD